MTATPYNSASWSITAYTLSNGSAPATTWVMLTGATRPVLLSEGYVSSTQLPIVTPHQLQLADFNYTASYNLGANIDMTSALANNGDIWGSNGFTPIGATASSSTVNYSGTFDGQGYIINGLSISNTASTLVGLFAGVTKTGTVANVGLTNINYALNSSAVRAGGLAGYVQGAVAASYTTGSITAGAGTSLTQLGGFVGLIDSAVGTIATIKYSYANVNLTATGTSASTIGGFAGQIQGTSAATDVQDNYSLGNITSSVTNTNNIGGFAGNITNGGVTPVVQRNYSTGNITQTNASNVKGFVGLTGGTVSLTNNFYDSTINTNTDSTTGVTGLSTTNFMNFSSFSTAWSGLISNTPGTTTAPAFIWYMPTTNGGTAGAGGVRPMLMAELFPITITTGLPSSNTPYSIVNGHQLELMGSTVGINYTLGANVNLFSGLNNVSDVWGTNQATGSGTGFLGIGVTSTATNSSNVNYTGTFNGNNYQIQNFYQLNTTVFNPAGLFYQNAGLIENMTLTNAIVSGTANTGNSILTVFQGGAGFINNVGIVNGSLSTTAGPAGMLASGSGAPYQTLTQRGACIRHQRVPPEV